MDKPRNKIQKLLETLGLYHSDNEEYTVPYDSDKYRLTKDAEKIKAHRDFLRSMFDQEESRMAAIENKTSQLVAQTGIVFSLLSLFVPIFLDKASSFSITIKLFLIGMLIMTFLCYGLTITNALKNYRINKFKYAKPSPNNVLLLKDRTVRAFWAEEVRDLLRSIKINENINNRKGTNLLHAYKAFNLANVFAGILVVFFAVTILFLKPEKNEIIIVNSLEIKKLDSLIEIIDKKVNSPDTIVILKDSCLSISQ